MQDVMLSEYYTTKPQARTTLLDEIYYKIAIYIAKRQKPYFQSSKNLPRVQKIMISSTSL
jgi:hypothetical protein